MTPSSFTRAYVAHDLGGDLHRLAQRAAVVAASLYVTGLAVGVVIHWANDWLSGDRRPWPVAWGAAEVPDPLSSMVCTAWIIDESGRNSFVDLISMPFDELRTLAMNQGLRYTKGETPVRMSTRGELISALGSIMNTIE
jgi:hypothetical protein